jgi:hypothetical protein
VLDVDVIPASDPRWDDISAACSSAEQHLDRFALRLRFALIAGLIASVAGTLHVLPDARVDWVASMLRGGWIGPACVIGGSALAVLVQARLLDDSSASRQRRDACIADLHPWWVGRATVRGAPLVTGEAPITGTADVGTLLATTGRLVFVPTRTSRAPALVAWDDAVSVIAGEGKRWGWSPGAVVTLTSGDTIALAGSKSIEMVEHLLAAHDAGYV